MRYTKILNRVMAGLSLVYAGIATWSFSILNDFIGKYPDFENLTLAQQTEAFDVMLYVVIFLMFIFSLALLVLGIITWIANSKLPQKTRGRKLGIYASMMTVTGFLIGLVPVASTIYILISIIAYLISAYLIDQEI